MQTKLENVFGNAKKNKKKRLTTAEHQMNFYRAPNEILVNPLPYKQGAGGSSPSAPIVGRLARVLQIRLTRTNVV